MRRVVGIATCLLLLACSRERGFRLAFTGDTFCTLYECGCVHGPAGGLARRATLLHDLGEPRLVVDAGGLGKDPGSHIIRDADSERQLLRKCFRSMAQMGYVAACVDDELLENGPTFLASVERDTGFRLLSANLQDAAGQPVLPAFTETTVGNVRVAVIGLTGFPSGPPEGGVPGGMRFEDPEVSLSRVLALLANDPPEVILLLAHLDLGETRDLMLRHPEIAAAVLGHSYTLPGTQNDAEGRPIYYVTFEGKRVGVVNVTLTAKGPVFSGYDRASVERSLVPDGEIQAIIDGR